jgi:hypothetical protein
MTMHRFEVLVTSIDAPVLLSRYAGRTDRGIEDGLARYAQEHHRMHHRHDREFRRHSMPPRGPRYANAAVAMLARMGRGQRAVEDYRRPRPGEVA